MKDLIEKLKERKLTVGFAESCTGGLLSSAITEISGASAVFQGSVVSYSNQVKMDLLKVSDESLKSFGAVSAQVALEMAKGVCSQLRCDWSIAVTGIAGPTGGTPQKPVGTVFFAVVGPTIEITQKKQFSGTRREIQNQSVNFAVEFLLKSLG